MRKTTRITASTMTGKVRRSLAIDAEAEYLNDAAQELEDTVVIPAKVMIVQRPVPVMATLLNPPTTPLSPTMYPTARPGLQRLLDIVDDCIQTIRPNFIRPEGDLDYNNFLDVVTDMLFDDGTDREQELNDILKAALADADFLSMAEDFRAVYRFDLVGYWKAVVDPDQHPVYSDYSEMVLSKRVMVRRNGLAAQPAHRVLVKATLHNDDEEELASLPVDQEHWLRVRHRIDQLHEKHKVAKGPRRKTLLRKIHHHLRRYLKHVDHALTMAMNGDDVHHDH